MWTGTDRRPTHWYSYRRKHRPHFQPIHSHRQASFTEPPYEYHYFEKL